MKMQRLSLRSWDKEGEQAALEYLLDWDMEEGDIRDEPPWGNADFTFSHDGYTMSYNRGLGYVSLCKVSHE